MKNTTLFQIPIVMALVLMAGLGLAESNTYRFDAVEPMAKVGKTSELDVRLTEAATGKLVTDANITGMRLDMGPDNMADMAASVKQVSSTQPGVYRFTGDVMAPGQWALRLTASVPGRKEPANGVVVFKALQ